MLFRIALSLLALGTVTPALALDVDAVASGMGEENLAPPPHVAAKPVVPAAVSATAATVPAAADAPVVAAAVDPYTVKGVVVTLSGTAGFDRDAALEKGARDSLAGVLVANGVEADKATKSVKSLGNAMRFVKSYKVVKETLIPSYTLTADLTFNDKMLEKNFGYKTKVKAEPTAAAVDGAVTAENGEATLPAEVPLAELRQWVVKIEDSDPARVDGVRVNLNKQAATKAVYRLITAEGAELLVSTPLDMQGVRGAAGMDVVVSALAESFAAAPAAAATAAPAATGGALQPWQGQDDKPMATTY